MGLLSNPSNKQLSPLLIKFVGKQKLVSILFYFGGIVWFVCLAYRQFNAGMYLNRRVYNNYFSISVFFFCYLGTYFSENALLPGLVHSNFKEDSLARKYLTSLKVLYTHDEYPPFKNLFLKILIAID
jgi:glycosylphosphatidylinositol transamidase